MNAKPFKLTPPKPFIPTEFEEQCQVFDYAHWKERTDPRWKLLFATLNGVRLPIGLAKKMKRAGMKAGVLDIWLPIIRRFYDGNICNVGLVIDIKRRKGGAVSDAQEWWADQLRSQLWRVDFCKGAKSAIATIEEYLG